MGMSVTGVTPAATITPATTTNSNRNPSETGVPDFGPAITFTPSSFDQAVAIQMYNSAGNAIALTQWMRSGTLPAPGSPTLSTMA